MPEENREGHMEYVDNANDEAQELFDKANFQDHFYLCLYGELVKVFGLTVVAPYLTTGNSLGDVVAHTEGTAGWYCALKESCKLCGLEEVLTKYNEMKWYASDLFDDLVGNKMVEVVLKGEKVSPYYTDVIDKNGGVLK